ncbi:MAG: acetyl-CoA carboxylase carboxyltransferase subunit beta [Armatimonadota bacterium]|nr:acetyl-CoA carboxylase carboxyl transferase subunit beta [Armatimonadota bacterium]MCX7776456.1 acetyl-CoA carboxylase carboxyl transferase subunit beta [Armatimonadota bacterium]MDW8024254.1 acetyl-CoA carboxylase carboxyltransferase subunit beta [Armatimonadota bacterium]
MGDAKATLVSEAEENLWVKCEKCNALTYRKEYERELRVCPQCGYHERLGAWERLKITVDEGTFEEWDSEISPADPLNFPEYKDKLEKSQRTTNLKDAALTGVAEIEGIPVAIGITDFKFMGGSMGSVLGEKITRLFERAVKHRLPVFIISGSGGGARMQEGLLSLMQMPKTCAACAKLHQARLPYIILLTDSMAGVQASFGALADITLAEPGAMVGFTGPRVIELSLKIKVPIEHRMAEFQFEHGMIDMIVPRKLVRPTVAKLLRWMCK